MVRLVHLLLVLVACLSLQVSAADLSVVTDADQVEMGKYLNARIVYAGRQAPGPADLREWRDDFYIDRRDSETENLLNGDIRTTEHLRLYPRRPGGSLLESIALGGTIAPPKRIRVLPAVRNGIDGTPHWLPLPKQVWQGQTLEIGIQVALLHPSNRIAVEDFSAPGFEVRALPRTVVDTGQGKHITLRWHLTAKAPGALRIEAPVIEQRGRGRWRYYLPIEAIEALPLPSYIPPTVPVGEIAVTTALRKDAGRPVWEIRVESQGMPDGELYGIRARMAALTGLAADVISAAPTGSETGTSIQTFRAPLPAWSWGLGDGPKIRIPYFDTEAGLVRTIERHLPAAWSLPRPAQKGLVLAEAVALLLAGWYATQLLLHIKNRHSCQQRIRRAKNPDQIRQLLLARGHFRSLEEWAAYQDHRDAEVLAATLNRLCFSPQSSDRLDQARKLAVDFCACDTGFWPTRHPPRQGEGG